VGSEQGRVIIKCPACPSEVLTQAGGQFERSTTKNSTAGRNSLELII